MKLSDVIKRMDEISVVCTTGVSWIILGGIIFVLMGLNSGVVSLRVEDNIYWHVFNLWLVISGSLAFSVFSYFAVLLILKATDKGKRIKDGE